MTVLPEQIFCPCSNTNMGQRAVIKFHAKLGKNTSETFWLMQQVYSDDCLSRAPSHTLLIVRQFFARNQVCELNHPPYSPDLTP